MAEQELDNRDAGQNRVRGREEDDGNGDGDGRNVRQNRGPPRPDWAVARVPLTTTNLTVKSSPMTGVCQVQRFDPNIEIISPESLWTVGWACAK